MKQQVILGVMISVLALGAAAGEVREHERMIEKSEAFQERFEQASPEQQKEMLERRNVRLKMIKEERMRMKEHKGQGADWKQRQGHQSS
ncbi:hypothetical protein N9W46_07120 [Litoricolaceae bacterium]|nr:hypothetical protein [Litorivicinaceae bacterium]